MEYVCKSKQFHVRRTKPKSMVECKDLIPLIQKMSKAEKAKLINHLAVGELKKELKQNAYLRQMINKELQEPQKSKHHGTTRIQRTRQS